MLMIKVSFILPMYNEEESIADCIKSILSQARYCNKLEIIVVDNGSTDSGPQIAEQMGAVVIRKIGGTIASVRNAGAAISTGDYLGFIDSDCVLPVRWLEVALGEMLSHSAGACGAGYLSHDKDNWIERSWFYEYKKFIGKCRFIPSGNFFIKRSAFEDVGGFSEDLVTCEDADICERLVRLGYDVIYHYEMQSNHLDSPKNLIQFIKKEFWYGSYQLKYYKFPSFDKVLFASLLYFFVFTASFLFLFIKNEYFFLSFIVLNFIALSLAIYRCLRSKKKSKFVQIFFLSHCYLLGRSLGIVCGIKFK